ncbi:MAG: RecQ family ATP-dependent DNA helicase [Bacteroides sp.]|nr:RecQ family ATP-dependent DNA helicase [Bacteroides sp.]
MKSISSPSALSNSPRGGEPQTEIRSSSEGVEGLNILKQYWGYDSFRGIQEEIIHSISEGRDTLGLMPTGGGKSITFQVPALAKEGMCLVVTPLIALMKDQVQNLKRRGIRALAIYSGMTREQIIITLENAIFGNYKFLYISPERLGTDIFRIKLRKMNISMITVDESHCISQWGYDFRPAYLKIAEVRHLLPDVPVLALTATATPEVVKDIQERLEFKEKNVFRMSFERKNLAYVVRRTENKNGELLHILNSLPGSCIVYVRNRRRTKEVAELLNQKGIVTDFYHAGLDDATKDLRQRRWQQGISRVIVATNAFGMGIDKPDVRLVVHLDLPDSIEAYFQEAGRAGRDGKKAYAVILYAPSDKTKLHKRIAENYPEKEYIKEVYEHLQYYYQMAMGDGEGCVREFNIEEFCRTFKHFPVQVDSALKLLALAGYIEYTEEQDSASRLHLLWHRDDFYKLRDTEGTTELILNDIMRNYTGVFTDAVFINEDSIAVRTGLTRQQIYDSLISLSKRRIAQYIPRKKTPYIIYTRERVESKHIHIPRAAYEERKERYEKRINAIVEYVESETVCRSRILLDYFGERNEHNCGICDTCLEWRNGKRKAAMPSPQLEEAIVQILGEQPLPVIQLAERLHTKKEMLVTTLQKMLEEQRLTHEEGVLKLLEEES